MINQKKRKTSVIGASLFVVYSVVFAVACLILLYYFDFSKFSELLLFKTLYIIFLAEFALTLFSLIFCCQIIKSPFNKKGKPSYRTGKVIFLTFLSLICAGSYAYEIISDFKALLEDTLLLIETIVLFAICLASFVLFLVSLLTRKNKFKVKEVMEKQSKQTVQIDTMYVAEKLNRLKQLRSIGTISESQYKEEVNKISSGL